MPLQHKLNAPRSMAELVRRVDALAARRFADIAAEHNVKVPPDLRRHKGWVGMLIEEVLGADAASRDEPDFTLLGVELKTLPVDARGRPCESTYVCNIPLDRMGETSWEQSRVRCKLQHVMWLIIQGSRDIPLAERQVGAGLLWRPSPSQEQLLRRDWEELSGIIASGDLESISARQGEALQVRPKAANARSRRRMIDEEGELSETMPRGFYLRTSFTAQILANHFGPPAAHRLAQG